jgi:hypothetical protein
MTWRLPGLSIDPALQSPGCGDRQIMRRTLWRADFDDARYRNSLPLKEARPGIRGVMAGRDACHHPRRGDDTFSAARGPVGCQNCVIGLDLVFHAARSYSLMRPPRTARRWIRSFVRSATACPVAGSLACAGIWFGAGGGDAAASPPVSCTFQLANTIDPIVPGGLQCYSGVRWSALLLLLAPINASSLGAMDPQEVQRLQEPPSPPQAARDHGKVSLHVRVRGIGWSQLRS